MKKMALFLTVAALASQKAEASEVVADQLNPNSPRLIVVYRSKKILMFFENGELKKKYRIGVGKPRTPTPVGEGFIRSKGRMVFRYDRGRLKGKIIRWTRLNDGRMVKIPYHKIRGFGMAIPGYDPYEYYIHSTTDDTNVGKDISKGCVRMRIKDMLELFPLVEVGDKIVIRP